MVTAAVQPPAGAKFYPFWTLTSKEKIKGFRLPKGTCIWNFGNVIPGVTTQNFGKDAQYGQPDLAIFGGTSTSPVQANPQFSGACNGPI